MRLLSGLILLFLLALVYGCRSPVVSNSGEARTPTTDRPSAPAGNLPKIAFRDVAQSAGLNYSWKLPDKPTGNILDLIGNGCAFLDYNNDGNLDILLVGPKLALYKGDGKGHFTDVTKETGLDKLSGHFLGCATGDFNNDGFVDIYINAYRGGVLLQNHQGKEFVDVAKKSGIPAQPWGTTAAFADLEGDGKLDLYIGNYVQFGPETIPQLCTQNDLKTACSPRQYSAAPGHLYHGNGDGTFRDITKSSGFDTLSGKALGVAIADYDGSGRLSVAVANDETPGDLMKNLGNGQFKNIAKLAGTATDNEGNLHGGMGTDWGDVEGKGRLDLLVATYQNEPKNIYQNAGQDLFTDKSLAFGLSSASPYVSFGGRFVDFDNDGVLDLVLSNGHVQDNIQKIDSRTTFLQPTLFFQGVKGKGFVDITGTLDKAVTRPIMGRGLAVGDYDNDGRPDILVVDSQGKPLLLHNETSGTGHFLGVSLSSPDGRNPLGAVLTATVGEKTLVRYCHTDGSYMSASDSRVLFGLGNETKVDKLTIKWPGGGEDTYTNLPVDGYIRLTRGKSLIP